MNGAHSASRQADDGQYTRANVAARLFFALAQPQSQSSRVSRIFNQMFPKKKKLSVISSHDAIVCESVFRSFDECSEDEEPCETERRVGGWRFQLVDQQQHQQLGKALRHEGMRRNQQHSAIEMESAPMMMLMIRPNESARRSFVVGALGDEGGRRW